MEMTVAITQGNIEVWHIGDIVYSTKLQEALF